MKKKSIAAICVLLCAAASLTLVSCGIRRETAETEPYVSSGETSDLRAPETRAVQTVTEKEPSVTEAPAGPAAQTDRQTEAQTDAPIEPEPVSYPPIVPIEIDGEMISLQYTRITPAVNRAMITSTQSDKLETHGDFSGCEEALAELETLLQNFDGYVTVIGYSVDGSRSITYNTGNIYQPQCTYKAAFIFSVCQYLDAIGFDDSTTIPLQEHNRMEGSGIVKNYPAGTQVSVRELINLCLSISDNTAYNMLHEYFGGYLRNAFMGMIGANDLITSMLYGNNIATGDFIILWNEIYNYFQSGTYYANVMREACTNTPYAYARPENGLSYSHKSGDGFDSLECHDVELVWDSSPYIFSIYTHAYAPDGSDYLIQSAARIVHEKIF